MKRRDITMSGFKVDMLVLLAAGVAAGCSSSAPRDGNHSVPVATNQDASQDVQTDAVPPAADCSGRTTAGEVPAEHRAAAMACAPSTRSPAIPDAGLVSCTTSADCTGDGGQSALFATCLHGTCSFDQCLVDADCGAAEVCACSSDYYGGNGAYHANVCVPGNCHVDADCGAGGYCSPSRGHCGSFQGFYCHTPSDRCVDPARDCDPGCANACVYAPTTGAFVCGISACAG
jgi:hypothetical protein